MLKRVSALCALGLVLGSLSLQAQDVFVLPGAGSASGLVSAYTANPLSQITTFNSGNGSFLVLPTVDATKFYIIADSSTQTVTSNDVTFLNPVVVANLAVPATAAVMTPDGRLLAVAAGDLHIFNTTTNTEIVAGGFSQGTGITTFGVAASLDATALYALGSTGSGTSQITAFSIATSTASAHLTIPAAATAVAVGPNGLVYVSLPNEILELDPRTLQPTAGGSMGVSGTPGPLVFTPDGKYAVAVNESPLASSSLLIVALATHTVTAPNVGVPQLSGLLATGIDTVSGFSGPDIYQISVSNPSATQMQFPTAVLGLTASNEVPAGTVGTVQNLYAETATTIYRITPATSAIAGQLTLSNTISPGPLSFAAPTSAAAQAHLTSLLAFGSNQSILPSASSEPLVVQVLDSNNHPVIGAAVQFQSSASGATLSTVSTTTEANGYALTYLTAPATAGSISVTASVGSLTANFNIDVTSAAGGASSPKLSIIAGQGQLLNADTNTDLGADFGSPLEVLVTDSNGNPLPGVPVTFSVPSSGGSIVVNNGGGTTQTVNTGAAGTAEVNFLTTTLSPTNNTGFAQATVTVTAPGTNTVVFYITTVNEIPSPTVFFLSPTPGTTLTGPAGSILPGAVTAQVYSSCPSGCNIPIPNVSLTLNDGNLDPSVYPTVSCNAPNGGAVLTTTSGEASCDVLFGPRIGSGTFTATVGYTRSSFSTPFTVTAGSAAVVQIVQGNNQIGNTGQTLPLALEIHVTDAGGNTIASVPVSWQVVTAGTVTLSNESTATNSSGNASAIATLGSVGGVVQVKVIAGSASAVFNLTVNIPSSGIQKISGDLQTTLIYTTFSTPLTVEVVNSSGGGVAGVPVTFLVTSGSATLGSASVTTSTNGQASTTVIAGSTPGTITISATSATFSVTFTLTALPIGPSNLNVVNGASFDPSTGISPGGIATITGAGFLTGVQGLVTPDNIVGPLPTTLDGVTVTFGPAGVPGTPAPIYYVQSLNGVDTVTVQVPFDVQPGPVSLTVSVTNGGSTSITVPVKLFAPGVFTTVYNGQTYAVAIRPDGSEVSPTNPAQLGENISFYVTGLGPVTPATATGDVGVPGQSLVPTATGALPMIVGLNNGGVPLVSATYAPGLVGVYVITLQVPATTKTGPYQPVGIIEFDSANNIYFAQPTYIPIQ
jgi:uncharacterized protein (TIGR03437 family)